MKKTTKTVSIVGAGPAGLMTAYKLGQAGIKVNLFDHQSPWEKPCGGLLSSRVMEEFPLFMDYPYETTRFDQFVYESPSQERKSSKSNGPFNLVSRLDLSRFLLSKAASVGVELIHEKANKLDQKDGSIIIETGNSVYSADLIVGADGASSRVRNYFTEKIPKQNLALTCGYFLKQSANKNCIIKYLDIEGYCWIFPGPNHTSAGIGSRLGKTNIKDLFQKLDKYLQEALGPVEKTEKWSTIVPFVKDPAFFERPCSGVNWILVGDAAGHVDPVTGEGIYYALKSAEFAAEAIIGNDLFHYDSLWRESYRQMLSGSAIHMKKLGEIAEESGLKLFGTIMYNNSVYEGNNR